MKPTTTDRQRRLSRFPVTPAVLWALGVQTLRQCLRRRVLLVLLFFVGVVGVGQRLMPTHDAVKHLNMLIVLCLWAISFFGIIVAIFLAATVLPEDRTEGTITTVMTKPVGRLNYLLGRILGDRYTADFLTQPTRELMRRLLSFALLLSLFPELFTLPWGQRACDVGDRVLRRIAEILCSSSGLTGLRRGIRGFAVSSSEHHRRELEVLRERIRGLGQAVGHRQRLAEVASLERFLEVVQAFARASPKARLIRTERLLVEAIEKLRDFLCNLLELPPCFGSQRLLLRTDTVEGLLSGAPSLVGHPLLLHLEVADRIHGLHHRALARTETSFDQGVLTLREGPGHRFDRLIQLHQSGFGGIEVAVRERLSNASEGVGGLACLSRLAIDELPRHIPHGLAELLSQSFETPLGSI